VTSSTASIRYRADLDIIASIGVDASGGGASGASGARGTKGTKGAEDRAEVNTTAGIPKYRLFCIILTILDLWRE
jgi:hypothetical protein